MKAKLREGEPLVDAAAPRLRSGLSAFWAAARWWSTAFLAATVTVAAGLSDVLDREVLALARPHDEWVSGQVRWVIVVDALRPPVVAAVLTAVCVAVCLLRRAPRLALVTVATGMVAAAMTVLVKLTLARPDPHVTGTGHGGSFPSGHTVAVVVCAGLAVCLLRPGARMAALTVAAGAGVVMAVALVVIGAHWASDVVGGLLLGLAVVAAGATAIRNASGRLRTGRLRARD
jgi:undecaprenyl-diphosphatase